MPAFDSTFIAMSTGALAIAVASAVDFHVPHRVVDVRCSVMRDRYYFALLVYVTSAALAYFGVLKSLTWLARFGGVPDAAAVVAIPAAILVILLLPHLPAIGRGIDLLRGSVQTLARYPHAVETVTAIIARSPIEPSERSQAELRRELEGYGVSTGAIDKALADSDDDVLAAGASQALQQVAAFHSRFAELRSDGRFDGYFEIRKPVFDDLETRYCKMVRGAARAFLLAEDITVSDLDARDLVLGISDLIAEDCEALRSAYQRMLAEIVLSVAHDRDARIALIARFGISLQLPEPLPLAPLVLIFLLDFAISVGPMLPMLVRAEQPPEFSVSFNAVGMSALAHAAALTISILLAVYPKASTNFARPSLYALPWRSYFLFGAVSFLVGTAILQLTYLSIDIAPGWLAHSHPLIAAMMVSLIFLFNTVFLSILVDIRLRAESIDYLKQRLRDGLAHGCVMMATMAIVITIFINATLLVGLKTPLVGVEVYVLTVGLSFCLGFFMGYLVPSTAEAYLEANQIIHKSAGLDKNLLGWAMPGSGAAEAVIASSRAERREAGETPATTV